MTDLDEYSGRDVGVDLAKDVGGDIGGDIGGMQGCRDEVLIYKSKTHFNTMLIEH